MDESLRPPQSTKLDKVVSVARGLIGELPGGSTGVELLGLVFTEPLERRRAAWMESICAKIQNLSDNHGVKIEDLRNNDAFIDTVVQATRAASLTSEAEKLDSLRNAVFNAGTPDAPDAALQQVFVAMVERLTTWHLRILNLFQAPENWFTSRGRRLPQFVIASSLSQLLTEAYPELQEKRHLYDQFWRDLHQLGLVTTDSLHTMMSATGAYAARTSEFGNQFLAFITEAPEPQRPCNSS